VTADEAAASTLERLEVRPTTQVAVLRHDGDGMRLDAVRWGVQPTWSKRPVLNARSDKLTTSRLWKRLAGDAGRRVLFVADGWYEWLHPEKRGSARPQPFLHQVGGGRLFAMAGLLDVAVINDEKVPAATIVTTDAVGEAARLHHRMPVVLPDTDAQRAWLAPDLSPTDVVALCAPLAADVSIEPVTLGAQAA